MGNPHILAIPYPAQGHVTPMMELSLYLVKHGFKVTFVNTEYVHSKILNSMAEKDYLNDQISLISIPDGMEPWEERNNLMKLTVGMYQIMPGKLEEVIEKINASEDDKIRCVIADQSMGWALEVADKMKTRRAVFWPAPAAAMCFLFSLQKLIDDGFLDNNGTPLKNQMIQLSPAMPAMNTANFLWTMINNLYLQKIVFSFFLHNAKLVKKEDKIICISSYNLEPGAFTFSPQIIPIGPLLTSNEQGHTTVGNFLTEDSNCLNWLDKQPPKSVIYVAFGSTTIFTKTQFQELALGLELTNKPFLWVVRPDTVTDNISYPEGFQERVKNGKIVNWAPQKQVLSHSAVACFLSHCGWNSVTEGVSNGVPFLCWPYFSDHFIGESYICDFWKVGLRCEKNESGIVTKEEIKNKIEEVVGDESLMVRALGLQEIALESIGEGGHSNDCFKNFMEWIKS
ncbi:UDP-glycosyltransferase 83A1-like [Mercurialis annua]|uniref:UDP-glycosyltransferase 83A1-like n=1 Tax=Mercurialis annua TaxID=3986 RepID=UPI0021608E9B|nr:UDP-glycosyltransferase 83A1-like [Mercurialis annua]